MKDETLPRVYARALLELAEEKGILAQVHEEIAVLDTAQRGDPLIRTFSETPRVSRTKKHEVIDKVFRGRVSDIVVDFIHLVIKRGRVLSLRDMWSEFLALYDDKVGLVHARAFTAAPLSDSTRQVLLGALEKGLQKTIDLQNVVDPDVLGGILVRFAGMVADGSLRTDLWKIRARMLEPRFGSELIQ
jgi:F-type H+-transporting ATPase subunit delta